MYILQWVVLDFDLFNLIILYLSTILLEDHTSLLRREVLPPSFTRTPPCSLPRLPQLKPPYSFAVFLFPPSPPPLLTFSIPFYSTPGLRKLPFRDKYFSDKTTNRTFFFFYFYFQQHRHHHHFPPHPTILNYFFVCRNLSCLFCIH